MNDRIIPMALAVVCCIAICAVAIDADAVANDITVKYYIDGEIVDSDLATTDKAYFVKDFDDVKDAVLPDGCDFVGWFVLKDSGWAECDSITFFESDAILYAGFMPSEYVVTFVDIGTATVSPSVTGSNAEIDGETVYFDIDPDATAYPTVADAVDAIVDAKGNPTALPDDYAMNDDGTAQYVPLSEETLETAIEGDISIETVYDTIWTVTWIVGDARYQGTTEMDSEGTYIALDQPAVPSKDGYTFKGWAIDGVAITDSDGILPDDYGFVGDTVLTATFAPGFVTVTFEYLDGTVSTVEIAYGTVMVAPSGNWDFDFSKPISSDATIVELPADPVKSESSAWIFATVLAVLVILALIAYMLYARNAKSDKKE